MSKFEYLKDIYENLDHTASYSGIDKLYNYVKKKNEVKNITKKDVSNFLMRQNGYQFHGNVPRKFVRRPIKVSRPGSILGTDICDLTGKISRYNKGYRYILVLIDLFSRKVHLTPLKKKTCKNFADTLDRYLENSTYRYSHIFSDSGGEFLGKEAEKIYDKYNIIRYNVFNRRFKCSIAERYIRDLKSILYRYFTQNNTFGFLDILSKIEKIHNTSPHRGLGNQIPNNIHKLTDLNEIKKQEKIQLDQKFKNYGKHIRIREEKKLFSKGKAFTVGTYVRILLNAAEGVFSKSYDKIYSDEIFVIRKVDENLPVSYWISDLKNRDIRGVVYHSELKKILLPDKYYVDRIINTRKNIVTGNTEYLVKWLGYSDEFNSYVDKVYKL